MESILKAKGLKKYYGNGDTMVKALDGQKPDKQFIMRIVKLLGLDNKLDSLPNNLSGGQQQRVAIAHSVTSRRPICHCTKTA